MALAEVRDQEQAGIRSVAAARAAGAEAVAKLARAEQLRAEAVAGLIEFDALDAHVAEGFATPERRLAVLGNVVDREAVRLQRIVRFCASHTLVADALEAGEITVDHADVLRTSAHTVGAELFNDDLLDLLRAAKGVDFAVFNDRIRSWTWRNTPDATADQVEQHFNNRYVSMQGDLFGGVKGGFQLDAAGAAVLTQALETKPDPANSVAPQRTAGQRRADRLVELAELANSGATVAGDGVDPTGARRAGGSVDVVLDLPTLMGIPFDLDNHRDECGEVDWNSIQQSFTTTGTAPRPVLAQFFCDASYRQLITSGPRIVLDYNRATPDIPRALRRAIQRRDRCCQFAGCDRRWQWCEPFASLTSGVARRGLTTQAGQGRARPTNKTSRWSAVSTTPSSIKAAGNSPDRKTADYSPDQRRSLRSLPELLAEAHNIRPDHRALVQGTPTKQRLRGSNPTGSSHTRARHQDSRVGSDQA